MLDFRGPIMHSFKSPCPRTTSYKMSIETIALNCLVFEKMAFLYFGDRQRQTNRQTDEQMDRPVEEAALAVASGGLITQATIVEPVPAQGS